MLRPFSSGLSLLETSPRQSRQAKSSRANRRSPWPTTGTIRTASRGVISRRASARQRPASRSAASLFGTRLERSAAGGASSAPTTASCVASIGIRGQGNGAQARLRAAARTSRSRRCATSTPTSRRQRINDARLKDVADLQAELRAGPAPRARRQGHRRGRHRDAEPLARARDDLGAAGRQARLRREAGVAHGVGRPPDGRGAARATTRSCRSAR